MLTVPGATLSIAHQRVTVGIAPVVRPAAGEAVFPEALFAPAAVPAEDEGHVPQVGVTVHHPYQLLAGSLQEHLLA